MSGYPLFIPEFVLCTNSSLFWFKNANEPSEFRNYLSSSFLRNQSPFVAAVFELLVVGFQLSTSQYLIIEKSLCSYLVDHIILRFLYLYIF